MSVRKAITVHLEPADYDRLEAEAKRLGMQPGALARVYVRAGLAGNVETDAAKKRLLGLAALDQLAALTADLPSTDAVEVARESRADI